ncbi:hypothetical protein HZB89_01805 [archaeon]|nr:hypothetical protein [archaeon]
MIVMVNGGMSSSHFLPGFFLLSVFLSMNYFKGLQTVKVFLPLLASLALMAFLGRLVDEAFLETTAFNFMVLLSACWLVFSFRQVRRELPKVFAFALLFLMLSYAFSAAFFLSGKISEAAYGRQLIEGRQAVIYVYGIPENASDAEIMQSVSGFAEVESLQRLGWLALIEAKPIKDFRLRDFESALKESLKPSTYLLAEFVDASTDKFNFYRLYFLDGLPSNPEELIGRQVLDINITWFKEVKDRNFVELATKAKSTDLEQMLSILTKAKQAYAGRLLIVRV